MTNRILILVIEDNRLVREGLVALLDSHEEFKVVAAVEGANIALQHMQLTKPHVVLVDSSMGDGNSARTVADLRKSAPESRVVVMDLTPARNDVIDFVRAGANGFIVKEATVDDFIRTIRSVAEGATVVPHVLAGVLLTHIANQTPGRNASGARDVVRMTDRESEIAQLICEGLSNKEIALRLDIAVYTVKSHVHNILEKLALHSRLQIAAFMRNSEAVSFNLQSSSV